MFSATRFIALAALLAALSSAQLGTLPSCAQDCVTEFTSGPSIGDCSGVDAKCICESKNFLSGISCCLAGKCDAADQASAASYAQGFCKLSGVTDLPTAVSCTSTASSTASAAPSSTSASAASVTSSVSSAASNASSSISSAVSSASSSVSSLAASVSSSSSAAASPTSNSGPHNVAGLGAGVLGGLAAAVALL